MTEQRKNSETEATRPVALQKIESGPLGATLYNGNVDLIKNLKVRLQVVVGGTEISVGELFALKENSVLGLDRLTNDPVDIYLDGKPVARGNLVAVDDNFGVCITEISQALRS